MSATAAPAQSVPAVGKGDYLTDGAVLVQVRAKTVFGVMVEDAAHPWKEYPIKTHDLRRWRLVIPAKLEDDS